jgi:hypothetical protein
MSRGKQCVWLMCVVCAALLASCDAFDSGTLLPLAGGGSGGTGGSAAGGGNGEIDAGPCVPAAETCNGIDDDCDDEPDPLDPEADAYCDDLFHADSRCAPSGAVARCVRVGECADGFLNCDGLPSNGCEFGGRSCTCVDCEDAGDEDSGF